jgi:hypothetical protein
MPSKWSALLHLCSGKWEHAHDKVIPFPLETLAMAKNFTYINRVAPEHDKTSCSDENMNNARYAAHDFGGCYRCTLLRAAKEENEPVEPADED